MHKQTNFLRFPAIDKQLGASVIFASELQQHTHSFKYRAAWNVVQCVDAEGFIAASSGNFGQALACAAQQCGRACIIVMPSNSAKVKVDAVRSYGATIELIDTNVISRADRVSQLALKHPSYHISSAYDCHFVIEGNASLGREIAQAHPDADAVLAPIGGGGLSAGICLGLKAMGSEIELWGAEPAMADDAIRSLKAGRLLSNDIEPQTMADGARTVSLGQRNWEILKSGIHSIVPVSEQFIANGLRLFHSVGLRVEPTGALTLAALLQNPNRSKGKTIVAVISGGNVDEQIYQQILLERNNSYK